MSSDLPIIRVALVEDVRETRDALVAHLKNARGFSCVASCADAETSVREIPRAAPDIVLVDLKLPGQSGVECLRALRAKCPGARLMVLTNFEDPERIFQAIQAGASGYLLKRTPPTKILEAIRELHNGGAPMTPEIARRVLESMHEKPGLPPPETLTPREHEVLVLASKGLTYQQIAERLRISHGTVRTHFKNIYEKLHVHTRDEAIRRAGLK